jgi:transcriptional regulator with XRE-family HTH domain
MAVNSPVPSQNREWLRQLRRLKGYTLHGISEACSISHLTYMSVECGGKKSSRICTVKTISSVSTTLSIKMDLFYHRTDDEGRLIDKTSIVDVLALFSSRGFKAAVHTEGMIRSLFAPEIAEYLLDSITESMAQ